MEQEKLNKPNSDAFQSSAQSDVSQRADENISRASENQKIQNNIDEVHWPAGQHLEKQEQRANSDNKYEKAGAKNDPAKKGLPGRGLKTKKWQQNQFELRICIKNIDDGQVLRIFSMIKNLQRNTQT